MPIDATLTRDWQERLAPQRPEVQRRVECQQRERRPKRGGRSLERPQEMTEQDQRIGEVVEREQSRLRNFIRRRVPDPLDAEDVLQDVFYKLVEANRLLMPIDHVTGWLFRVARNRITDLFRKKRPVNFSELEATDEEGERLEFEDLLPARGKGAMSNVAEPEARYLRGVLLEALEESIAALPSEQREVFIAHELEGRSFAEMAQEKGVSVNTLLARKRYAVLALRERLREVYEEWER
jgi:RNA polymerase sigma factor (sigma-70 family)